MNLIEIAKKFATKSHSSEFRNDGVTPYISHCRDVAQRVANSYRSIDDEVAAAWLHDVCENCGVTNNDLLEIGMPYHVVRAVEILTKRPEQDYKEYLEGVIQNPIARKVKIHDMLSNLSDSPSRKQVKKYAEGLVFLLNGII